MPFNPTLTLWVDKYALQPIYIDWVEAEAAFTGNNGNDQNIYVSHPLFVNWNIISQMTLTDINIFVIV